MAAAGDELPSGRIPDGQAQKPVFDHRGELEEKMSAPERIFSWGAATAHHHLA
jgi:hypothetical protein